MAHRIEQRENVGERKRIEGPTESQIEQQSENTEEGKV